MAEGPAPAEVCRGPTLSRTPPWWPEGTSGGSPSDSFPEVHFSLFTIQMGQTPSGSSSQLAIRGCGSSLVSLTLARTVQPPGPGRGVEVPPRRPRASPEGTRTLCPVSLAGRHSHASALQGRLRKGIHRRLGEQDCLWALSCLCLIPLGSGHTVWSGWPIGNRGP